MLIRTQTSPSVFTPLHLRPRYNNTNPSIPAQALSMHLNIPCARQGFCRIKINVSVSSINYSSGDLPFRGTATVFTKTAWITIALEPNPSASRTPIPSNQLFACQIGDVHDYPCSTNDRGQLYRSSTIGRTDMKRRCFAHLQAPPGVFD